MPIIFQTLLAGLVLPVLQTVATGGWPQNGAQWGTLIAGALGGAGLLHAPSPTMPQQGKSS